jgi:hypothetical protein
MVNVALSLRRVESIRFTPWESECELYVISSDLKVCQYFCQYGEALHQRLLSSTLFGIELSAGGKKGFCLE